MSDTEDLTANTDRRDLVSLTDDLSATATSRLPYQHNVLLRSFILRRAEGNVVVYNSPGVSEAADAIEALGSPERLLVNHAHEAMWGRPTLDVPVWVPSDDRAEIGDDLDVAGTFSGSETTSPQKTSPEKTSPEMVGTEIVGTDLQVIPTPGHTRGTTSYLWDSGRHRYLFTGDFVWIEDGQWSAVVLDESLRSDYVASLERVRDLDFDVLVPWGVTEGDEPLGFVHDEADKRARLTAVIDRVAAGSHR